MLTLTFNQSVLKLMRAEGVAWSQMITMTSLIMYLCFVFLCRLVLVGRGK